MRGSNFTDTTVPTHREPPLRLLLSGAELWVTNVLVFALWYWRLDGGGAQAPPGSTRIRRPQLRFPANADRKSRTAKISGGTLAPALRRLSLLRIPRRAQRLVLPTRHCSRICGKLPVFVSCAALTRIPTSSVNISA